MRKAILINLLPLVIAALVFLSCSYNIFSPFNPSSPNNVNDVDTLIALGDYYLNNLDYSDAFNAYSKAMGLAPQNSRAIEGSCTSYLFMRIPVTNLILSILNKSYSIKGLKNKLFDVSTYIQAHLYTIINNQADGVIPANDVNINLNFYFFNDIYSLFFFIDTDNNGDVENDTNDLISIDDNFNPATSARLSNAVSIMTNISNLINPIALLKVVPIMVIINQKENFITNNLKRSDQAMSNVISALASDQAKQELSGITSQIGGAINSLLSIINMFNTNYTFSLVYPPPPIPLGVTYNFAINPLGLTNYYSITNSIPIYTNITALTTTTVPQVNSSFANAGYANGDYSSFTSDVLNSGLAVESDVTNLMPSITTIEQIITNYFGL